MNKEYPFRNLVFRGGGVRCFAYHGVLEVLEEEGILAQIDRVAGTSAGAATAALVSFRLSADETVALFKRMNYAKVRRRLASDFRDWLVTPPKNMQDSVARLKGNLDAFGRLLSNYGWYANDYSQQWLEGIISEQCDGNGRATFAEFRERGFRDLYMVATNLERHREEIFSATTTPDVAVADALVLSQSIPLFFEAPRFDGKTLGEGTYYADGGLVNDYPLQLFDAPTPEIVPVELRGLTLPEQFAAFDEANPGVYGALRKLALDAVGQGWRRGSIKLFFEHLRWLHAIRTRGSQYKLNNNWHAFYARKLMANEDELADFFEVRVQHCRETAA